jgi:hypothetical protein
LLDVPDRQVEVLDPSRRHARKRKHPDRLNLALPLPPEQPSDDGSEELLRRATAIVEGRGHRYSKNWLPVSTLSIHQEAIRRRSNIRTSDCSLGANGRKFNNHELGQRFFPESDAL